MQNFLPFISYAVIASFTPGPNNIMSLSCGVKYGYKIALRFILGVTSGFVIIMLASAYLNIMLYNILPKIKVLMYIFGSLYMLYLAYNMIKPRSSKKLATDYSVCSFKNGMVLQFINPKAILYGITITSSFIIPYYTANIVLISFSVALALLAFIATSSWALFGSIFQKFIAKYNKAFNIVMALLLLYCAVTLILEIF
jgi:cysteine/O-acetylserine efflux protein